MPNPCPTLLASHRDLESRLTRLAGQFEVPNASACFTLAVAEEFARVFSAPAVPLPQFAPLQLDLPFGESPR